MPIQFAIAKVSGKISEKEIFDFFKRENFKIFFSFPKRCKKYGIFKTFLNLIGMASASRGFSIEQGFSRKEVFEEEILAARNTKKLFKWLAENF